MVSPAIVDTQEEGQYNGGKLGFVANGYRDTGEEPDQDDQRVHKGPGDGHGEGQEED